MLNYRKETQSLASAGSKILGLSTLVIEQGLKQRKGFSLIISLILCEKLENGENVRMECC